jgi:acyl-CoA thioesterase FadM
VKKENETLAIGLATAVWVNLIKNKAKALPQSIKDKLSLF